MFDSWIIQDCICKKSEYTQYLVRAESDDESASFWVVDFPASAEDLLVLEENGMTASQAVEFFKHAAEDFFGSIQSEKNSENCESLLTVKKSELIANADNTHSVLLLTENVVSLNSILAQGCLPVEEVIKLGMQLCDAVSFVKNNGLPRHLLTIDNIFADYNGNYLLGCFGNEADNRFQSPEEHRGEEMLYNADVHSIGVILYMLLNNNLLPLLPVGVVNPTYEEIATAVQNRHAGVPLPPPGHCSAAFTGIVLKACSYKPKARFASVEDLKSALVNLRAGHVVVVSAADARRTAEESESFSAKKVISVIAIAVAVLIVSNFAIRLLFPGTPEVPAPQPVQQTTGDGFTVIIHTDPVQVAPSVSEYSVPDQPTQAIVGAQYGDDFFRSIAVYHSGHFHLKGVMEKDGENKPTELALSRENSIYMTSDIDGSLIGILRDKNGTVYLVDPNAKCYLELSQTILKLIGMDTDVIDNAVKTYSGSDTFVRPDEVYKVMYREQELVCCCYYFENGKKELFYLDENGDLQYIESYSSGNVPENVMIVESISGDIPPEFIAPTDSYTLHTGIKGMIAFVSGLAPVQ